MWNSMPSISGQSCVTRPALLIPTDSRFEWNWWRRCPHPSERYQGIAGLLCRTDRPLRYLWGDGGSFHWHRYQSCKTKNCETKNWISASVVVVLVSLLPGLRWHRYRSSESKKCILAAVVVVEISLFPVHTSLLCPKYTSLWAHPVFPDSRR